MSNFHILSVHLSALTHSFTLARVKHMLSLSLLMFPFLSFFFSLSFPADPHIKVCGKRENVREAKDRIMSVLDTKVQYASLSH